MKCDIILNKTTAADVYLSSLLGSCYLEQKPHEQFSIILTINQGTTVRLIDDLHSHLFLNTKIEFFVEQDAHLTYELSMHEGIDIIFGNSQSHTTLDTTCMVKEIIVRMVGPNGYANITGTCFGHERKIFRFKTLQEHQAPHATSNVTIKSVLDGEALFSCHSLISVAQEAQGTFAQQANKNILLSDHARATSIPMLEVLANDVTCKHGAAVSTFDDEQLFFLQSRGISLKNAKKMLVQAFLGC